ncbi:hypothetical protein GG344DRAFT_83220 [Lentinula edodes]|nr:hypothetical protein GG344DRAFT_83220 [Lentinula edodes]
MRIAEVGEDGNGLHRVQARDADRSALEVIDASGILDANARAQFLQRNRLLGGTEKRREWQVSQSGRRWQLTICQVVRFRYQAAIQDMGLEKHGVDKYQISSAKGMVAIGDVQGKALLTPVAIAAGRRLANKLFGPKKFKDDKLSYEDIPTVVSSYASIGTVILTEPQKVIGIHIIGMGSNEAMQGFGVAVKMGVRKQDLDDISRVTCRCQPQSEINSNLGSGYGRLYLRDYWFARPP